MELKERSLRKSAQRKPENIAKSLFYSQHLKHLKHDNFFQIKSDLRDLRFIFHRKSHLCLR